MFELLRALKGTSGWAHKDHISERYPFLPEGTPVEIALFYKKQGLADIMQCNGSPLATRSGEIDHRGDYIVTLTGPGQRVAEALPIQQPMKDFVGHQDKIRQLMAVWQGGPAVFALMRYLTLGGKEPDYTSADVRACRLAGLVMTGNRQNDESRPYIRATSAGRHFTRVLGAQRQVTSRSFIKNVWDNLQRLAS